ncbi:MAG: transcriptional regulator with XRE-family HTH domain [Saprospiraceae bacterium]|jgi:transcriptional regulator with XRE-family HTH domain
MNLRKIRKEKGLSQEKLAYMVDLSLSQVGRIEGGEVNPTICTVKIFAEGLEIEPNRLFQF